MRRVKKALGLAPPEVTAEELHEWSELLYDSCNLCGRCTLACPMGIDIASLVRRAREGMSAGGFAPADMYTAAERAIDTGSPIGVRWPALKRQIELQEQETGLHVPVDAEGAEYMVVLSSIEIMAFPEAIGAMARIFRQAGASWTIPSAGFEATNIGVQIGSRDVAAQLVSRIVGAAERLKVKCVISPSAATPTRRCAGKAPISSAGAMASRWCRSPSCSTGSCARAACACAARTRAA